MSSHRGGGSSEGEAVLMRMASSRPALMQLFYASLESEVVGAYMASRRRHFGDDKWIALVYGMHTSHTLYVGNLSFYTREEQVHELFARVAPVKRVIMGLNSNTRTPCGFCFVEYTSHEDAHAATNFLNGLRLDDRIIKADLDAAFEEGRQYGRGRSGGQINDDHRADFDAARGGWGTLQQARQERADAAKQIKEAQLDQFGRPDDQGDGEEVYDPETYGGGYDRGPSSNIFNIDQPLKLSASTLAACTEGVFPHYALPLDARVKKAIADHIAAANGTVAPADTAAASSDLAPNAAGTGSTNIAAAPFKRPHTPESTLSPPAAFSPAPLSPAAKRPRHTSPQSIAAAASRSPQPLAAAYPSSPQPVHPSSPQPLSRRHDDDDDHAMSYGDGGRSDNDRTPEHLDDDRTPSPRHDDDRTPQRMDHDADDRTPQQLDDDRTPPPRDDDDRTPQHMDEHDDRTPQHLDDDADDRTPQHLPDDDPTPPPAPEGSEEAHGFRPAADDDHMDFAAFEK